MCNWSKRTHFKHSLFLLLEQISWNNKQTSGKRKHCVSLLLVFHSEREAHQSKTEEMGRDNTSTALHYTWTLQHARCCGWAAAEQREQCGCPRSCWWRQWGLSAGDTEPGTQLCGQQEQNHCPELSRAKESSVTLAFTSVTALKEDSKAHTRHADCSHSTSVVGEIIPYFLKGTDFPRKALRQPPEHQVGELPRLTSPALRLQLQAMLGWVLFLL